MITMTIKFLLVILLVYLGLQMAKKALKNWVKGLLGRPVKPPEQPKMVLQACSLCGTQVDPQIGVTRKGRFFCSTRCAEQKQ